MTLLLLALGCTSSDDAPGHTGLVQGGDEPCREPVGEPWLVASKPFEGDQAGWATGSLEGLDGEMTLGRTFINEVAWTPDGQVGAVAHEDGSLSVFTREGVLAASMSGDWYASRVVADPSGRALWIVDGNWPNNGGGLFRLPLSCSDELGEVEKVLETKLAADLLFVDDGALVVATEVDGSEGHVHRLDGDMALVESVSVFDYEGSSPTDAELGPDGSVWINDVSIWGDDENRVVVLEPDLSLRAEVLVLDPIDLVVGEDSALVASGFGDELLLVGLDGAVLARTGSELPGSVVLTPDGALAAENTTLRELSLGDLSTLRTLSPGFVQGTVGLSLPAP